MSDTFADDDEILEDDDESARVVETAAIKASNAWRSIERHREMKELRKHLDDFLFDDIGDTNFKDLHL